jgi:hypothetical protein
LRFLPWYSKSEAVLAGITASVILNAGIIRAADHIPERVSSSDANHRLMLGPILLLASLLATAPLIE